MWFLTFWCRLVGFRSARVAPVICSIRVSHHLQLLESFNVAHYTFLAVLCSSTLPAERARSLLAELASFLRKPADQITDDDIQRCVCLCLCCDVIVCSRGVVSCEDIVWFVCLQFGMVALLCSCFVCEVMLLSFVTERLKCAFSHAVFCLRFVSRSFTPCVLFTESRSSILSTPQNHSRQLHRLSTCELFRFISCF